MDSHKPHLPNVSLAEAIKLAKLEHDRKEKNVEVDDKKKMEAENDLRKAISLSYLQSEPENKNRQSQSEKNNKSAKPEQLSALRNALITPKGGNINHNSHVNHTNQHVDSVKKTREAPREVPEDVLKKVFDVGDSGFK